MPIPQPNKGENKEKFISRCIESIADEYPQNQATAICYSQWRRAKKARDNDKRVK